MKPALRSSSPVNYCSCVGVISGQLSDVTSGVPIYREVVRSLLPALLSHVGQRRPRYLREAFVHYEAGKWETFLPFLGHNSLSGLNLGVQHCHCMQGVGGVRLVDCSTLLWWYFLFHYYVHSRIWLAAPPTPVFSTGAPHMAQGVTSAHMASRTTLTDARHTPTSLWPGYDVKKKEGNRGILS